MKKTIDTLKSFLEDAHKNGTDCQTAENELTFAIYLLDLFWFQIKMLPRHSLHRFPIQREMHYKKELLRIIAELKEIHRLCLLPEEQTADDNSECGV